MTLADPGGSDEGQVRLAGLGDVRYPLSAVRSPPPALRGSRGPGFQLPASGFQFLEGARPIPDLAGLKLGPPLQGPLQLAACARTPARRPFHPTDYYSLRQIDPLRFARLISARRPLGRPDAPSGSCGNTGLGGTRPPHPFCVPGQSRVLRVDAWRGCAPPRCATPALGVSRQASLPLRP